MNRQVNNLCWNICCIFDLLSGVYDSYLTAPYILMNLASVGYTKGGTAPPFMRIHSTVFKRELGYGFNIAVINGWTGSLEIFRKFDTRTPGSPDIEKMTSFLNNLPVDRVVAGVVKGEAFKGMRDSAKLQAALVSIYSFSLPVSYAVIIFCDHRLLLSSTSFTFFLIWTGTQQGSKKWEGRRGGGESKNDR